jgi:hypothetical protein
MKGPCSLSAFIGSEQSMAWWILTISCMLVHFQQSSVNPYTPHIVTQTCIRKTEEVLHPVRIQRFVVDVHVLICAYNKRGRLVSWHVPMNRITNYTYTYRHWLPIAMVNVFAVPAVSIAGLMQAATTTGNSELKPMMRLRLVIEFSPVISVQLICGTGWFLLFLE